MPPTPHEQSTPSGNEQQLSSKKPSSGAGPIIGVVVIVCLLIFGGLYFWGAALNAQDKNEQLPLILGDESTS